MLNKGIGPKSKRYAKGSRKKSSTLNGSEIKKIGGWGKDLPSRKKIFIKHVLICWKSFDCP